MDISVKEFRQILQRDRVFTDYINSFLNLPIFARRLTYTNDNNTFSVEPSVDSKIYNVDEDCVISWVCSCRLPLFFKSELFYEYKLCRALNQRNEVLQEYGKDVLTSVAAMYNFKKFLFQSEGEVLYIFWMDVEHLKCHQNYFYIRKLIIRISNTYIADGSPFQLSCALKEKLVSVEKMDEPQNRWNTKQQVRELVQCQAQVLQTLREYWCKRYVLMLKETDKLSKEKTSSEVKYSRKEPEGSHPDIKEMTPRRSHSAGLPSTRSSVAEEESNQYSTSTKYPPINQERPMRDSVDKSRSTHEHLPAVDSSDSVSEDATRKASHIKMSTSKIPLLFTGEKNAVTKVISNDTLANSVMHPSADPNSLISSSMYSLFSSSSSSILRFDLRDEISEDFKLEPFLCAALRADFTAGNPFLRFLKAGKRNPEGVNYMLFWQSVENILTQDEMRRWYTLWCVNNLEKEEDRPSPYLSYFEPYVVAKNLQELCLFFLQPKSLHKVKLPKDMQEQLGVLLPKGLGQGLLLAAQEYAVHSLTAPWKEYLLNDYKKFLTNCSAEKFPRRSSITSQHLQSVAQSGSQAEVVYTGCDVDPMWSALKHSEAIKYAGIHQLPSRNLTISTLQEICSEVPPPPKERFEDEVEAWQKQQEGVADAELCPIMTTLFDEMKWDMEEHKHTRKLLYTIKPTQFNFSNRKIYPPKNMMEILRDREHLEYFRNFLATKGEATEEAPLQFWLAVEDLKNHVHNSKKYNAKVQRIRDRFLSGNPYKVFTSSIPKDLPKQESPDLFKLITAQANIRLSLERKWLPPYLDFLEKEEEKKKEQEKKWEEEKREKLKKKREKEKVSAKKNLMHTLTHSVANFKKDLMNPTASLMFQKYLYDEVVKTAKNESKKMVATQGKAVNARKLLRDLGFWAEVERFKELISMVSKGQKKGTHTPEDYIMVYKKAHAIANCYMDSTIQPNIQVNVKEDTVHDILTRLSQGDITYNIFHRASMETFHVLFNYWRKFSIFRVSPKRRQAMSSRSRWNERRGTGGSVSAYRDCQPYDGGHILSFSLAYGLRWIYPGLNHSTPVTYHCEVMPNSPSYPTLQEIMKMAETSC